jgi:hypothetical protein
VPVLPHTVMGSFINTGFMNCKKKNFEPALMCDMDTLYCCVKGGITVKRFPNCQVSARSSCLLCCVFEYTCTRFNAYRIKLRLQYSFSACILHLPPSIL